ncbi:MAG: ribosome maturation factor RimM [Bacillota bacterium]|nr:ribosome maturation factor RimM [Bacillota bacterium]
MEKILIGKIVNAVGLKGEVRVYNYSNEIDIYLDTEKIYVGDKLLKIENVRTQKNMVVLKLESIDNRDQAERAKGTELFVTEDDLPELPEGEYYVRDLIGMDVYDVDTDEKIGEMTDVIQNTAQDVFAVRSSKGKEVLIPRVPEFVREIDEENRVIRVHLIEGMLDL